MNPKLLFVVAHPDDESLWIGGLLYALARYDFLEIYLICMTGGQDQPRARDFKKSVDYLGIKNWVHLGGHLARSRNGPIDELIPTFISGLEKLELTSDDIDLLVTHSPYGEEHAHQHHIQLYCELDSWTSLNNVPFAFFSFMIMPFYRLVPVLSEMRRDQYLHLINLSLCERHTRTILRKTPKYLVQFKVSEQIKAELLSIWDSIDLAEHRRGYAAWDSAIESLYLCDAKAYLPIDKLINTMPIPGGERVRNRLKSLEITPMASLRRRCRLIIRRIKLQITAKSD